MDAVGVTMTLTGELGSGCMDLRIHVLVWHIEAGARGRLKYTNKFLETKSWEECYSGRNAVCFASADVF